MKRILMMGAGLIGVIVICVSFIPVQTEESPVRWMTFEEAVERSKVDKRPVFIDVYTDW